MHSDTRVHNPMESEPISNFTSFLRISVLRFKSTHAFIESMTSGNSASVGLVPHGIDRKIV